MLAKKIEIVGIGPCDTKSIYTSWSRSVELILRKYEYLKELHLAGDEKVINIPGLEGKVKETRKLDAFGYKWLEIKLLPFVSGQKSVIPPLKISDYNN